jgi:hypothetical protein
MSHSPRKSADRIFLSKKAPTAIPVATELHYDVLCQSALDPTVTRIEFIGPIRLAAGVCLLDTITILRNGRRFVLEIGDAPTLRDLDNEGLYLLALQKLNARPLALSTREILREPYHSNARLVWFYRGRYISTASRDRILRLIDDTGPISIKALCHDLGSDLAADVYALACQSALYLDLTGSPLSGATIVRSKHVLRANRHGVAGRGTP